MRGKIYSIFVFIISVILLITTSCSNKGRPQILSEKAIQPYDNNSSIDCKKIIYLSDNLEVVGFLVKPKNIDGKLPVIIYNRGGNRELGVTSDSSAGKYFVKIASEGYVVLASQYRGNDGGEGREEFGGSDLNDVLNLIEIAKDLPYVNKEKIFMFGESRGGMMTYIACRKSDDIKAAAVIGAPSDLIQVYNEREQQMKDVLSTLIGGTPEKKEEEYIKRSAYYWADEVNVPMLILHGSRDWRAQVSQAEKMGEKLKRYGKDYKLIIYPNEDHNISNKRTEIHDEIFKWFDKYK